ncbi:MAG: 4-(cytidine 5'-diphospho)-2-C-methyl-D-erythritol kinase [Solobacterium sp.]|nr:4-(cytidine 5'-diphospho)-2-C-methyl-D-erythritol kinase [Solobacterium sp.]
MKERAFAKINLCLDVVQRREDGYHDLRMIMVPVDFYDVLEMTPADETTMSVNRSYLPVNDKNTVIKAIHVMQERYGFHQEFACNLQKHIPTQAGLAGGSADAAAAIRMMNRMMRLNLSRSELIETAKEVGADVPFCVMNRPSLVEGIGELLTPFTCTTEFEILLVKPRMGVSTKAAFGGLNFDTLIHPDVDGMKTALESGDYEGVVSRLGNSLEDVSVNLVKAIRDVKEELDAFGFDGVLMSGSGSTVFGITKSPRLVREASDLMRANGYFVRRTKIIDSSQPGF